MVFWRKSSSKKSLKKGLLSMEPKPVIKKDSIPSTSSNYKPIHPLTYQPNQKGDEGLDPCQFDEDLKCPICSEIFVESTTLNCSHTYCKYCINRWRRKNLECPVCRTHIIFQVNTLALDQLIDKLMKTRSQDMQKQRKTIIAERQKELTSMKLYEPNPIQSINYQIPYTTGVNIFGSILDVITDTDDSSDRMDDDFCDDNYDYYYNGDDDVDTDSDGFDEYCIYTGPTYF